MSKMRFATGFVLAVLGLVAAVAVGSTLVPESNTGTPAANTVEGTTTDDTTTGGRTTTDETTTAGDDGTPDQGPGDFGATNTTTTPNVADDHGRGRGRGHGRSADDDRFDDHDDRSNSGHGGDDEATPLATWSARPAAGHSSPLTTALPSSSTSS